MTSPISQWAGRASIALAVSLTTAFSAKADLLDTLDKIDEGLRTLNDIKRQTEQLQGKGNNSQNYNSPQYQDTLYNCFVYDARGGSDILQCQRRGHSYAYNIQERVRGRQNVGDCDFYIQGRTQWAECRRDTFTLRR